LLEAQVDHSCTLSSGIPASERLKAMKRQYCSLPVWVWVIYLTVPLFVIASVIVVNVEYHACIDKGVMRELGYKSYP
jgi:hypothetical protein